MVKTFTGLGILTAGDTRFVALEPAEGPANTIPGLRSTGHATLFCAQEHSVADEGLVFRNPGWVSVFGGAFIKWFPEPKEVAVQVDEVVWDDEVLKN